MQEKAQIIDGEPITQEQIQEIEEAKKLPITYDDDSPIILFLGESLRFKKQLVPRLTLVVQDFDAYG